MNNTHTCPHGVLAGLVPRGTCSIMCLGRKVLNINWITYGDGLMVRILFIIIFTYLFN